MLPRCCNTKSLKPVNCSTVIHLYFFVSESSPGNGILIPQNSVACESNHYTHMPKEVILKKLDQIKTLLAELSDWTSKSMDDFMADIKLIRASERNFQLMVELASDINTQILLEQGSNTPDSYRQSFQNLADQRILDHALGQQLVESAKIRNILVHEYDFEEDYAKFYHSVKAILPAYGVYIGVIYDHVQKQ